MNRPLPEENAEELYEHAPCGYFSTLPDGTMMRVNETFLRWTGYERAALLNGLRWMELMTTPGRIFYETHFAPLLLMQGYINEIACDLQRPGRTPLPVLINATRVSDAEGQTALFRFTVFDATDRRHYERELLNARRRAEHYATIVNASADAILSLEPDGLLQTWNAAAARMFGYSAAQAIGQNAWGLLSPAAADNTATWMWAELRAGRSLQLETVCRDSQGRAVDVAISLTPHLEPPGELTSVSAIIRDIGERKRAEQQLHERAAQLSRLNEQLTHANQELDAFTYLASHDLKEPLRGLSNYAYFLLEDYGAQLDEEGQNYLHTLIRLTERMGEQLDGLLRFSRLGRQPLTTTPTDLHSVILEALDLLNARLRETGADIRLPSSLPTVQADRSLLIEVLLNLISNALKYNDKETKWVEVGWQDCGLGVADRALIKAPDVLGNSSKNLPATTEESAIRNSQSAIFYVRDNGIGIAPEHRENVFRIFKRLHGRDQFGGGTGAGLTIVRKIIERHGGRIWLESEPGVGTTFYFTLNAAVGDSAAPIEGNE